MIVKNLSQDVTTYFVLRDSTNHLPKTDITVTDLDLYYVEELTAITAKVDASALGAANSAHADNSAFNVGQGVYRIDWPDAAFDSGIGKKVILVVVCSGVDTAFLEVELSPTSNVESFGGTAGTFASGRPDVNTTHIAGSVVSASAAQIGVNVVQVSGDATAADNLEAACDGTTYNIGGGAVVAASVTGVVSANVTQLSGDATAADNAEAFFDGTGYAGTNNVIPTVTTVSGSVGSVANGGITAASIATNAIDADAIATDAVTELQAGLSTLDAAGVRTALGMASANLDTQLDALPTANENADALLDRANAIETGLTPRQALRLHSAVLINKATGLGTGSEAYRDFADTKNRIAATISGGTRTVTRDAT